ncbi:rhamnogalacturonan acetylesterase [Hymenobacter cellulosivorans]|uniref:Rhamnogalacturonan acetylesterase n=1 Tax=Hymenobacter cellulosivorans TaxID=2932249 RepID=A0ABY4FE14_9BACT|nr:rhamnogalacturonan acetylesterase [Hymenobacter cellulosivorans]UOQ54924.1 rhamnogalacturonan acetylesterase [Hymenobacter cellulosivorans]
MQTNWLKRLGPLAMLLLLAFTSPPPKKIKLYLVGDSTIAQKIKQTFPETGWGMPLPTYFDSTVVVDNRAQNGRSTRTFLAENRWQPIVDALQEGDYVFIQFGHNDESEAHPDRYTSPADYRKNLTKFVTETRSKKGYPVLITPVTRRKFDKEGKIMETHVAYSAATMDVARELKVPLIDLDKMSRELLQKYGAEQSKQLFLQLEPGDHPNYPYGRNDNTHFSELGARKMAQLVVSQVIAQKLPCCRSELVSPRPRTPCRPLRLLVKTTNPPRHEKTTEFIRPALARGGPRPGLRLRGSPGWLGPVPHRAGGLQRRARLPQESHHHLHQEGGV